MSKKLHRIILNHKIRIFLFFLMISMGTLLLNKLTKEYYTTIPFKVLITKFPFDKILLKQPNNLVKLKVKATGFNIIGYQLWNKTLKIDAHKATLVKGTHYQLDTKELKNDFQKQLLFHTDIIEIIDKKISFEMGKMVSKKIPVVLNSQITFDDGYKIKGAINIVPDSISVFGPEDKIASIYNVKTNTLIIKKCNTNFDEIIDLNFTQEFNNVSTNNNQVKVSAVVEKYTELSLLVPFKIINNSQKFTIKSFPTKVKVVFQVALSEVSKIDASNFEIVCDLEKTQQNNLNYLIPQLIDKPNFITNYYIEPQKIDFLIKK